MYLILALFSLFSSTVSFQLNAGINRFSSAVIFGDSFTDTGNDYELSNHTWPLVPPNYQGRFCDGPNWVDRLNILQKSSYAYGGATTDNNLVQGTTRSGTIRVPGIRQQIAIYLNDTASNNIDFAHTLYIIWLGGNDYSFNPALNTTQVVNSLMNGVRDLLAVGAQNFLIFNQAPLQSLPVFNKGSARNYTALTIDANDVYVSDLQTIQQNNLNASINMFDIYALLTKVVANDTRTKFTDTLDACWVDYNFTTIEELCQDPSQYVFLENVRFTSIVYRIIADAISPFLSYRFNENAPDCYIRSF